MATISHIVPVVACDGLEEAIVFWRERLGFEVEWTWGEPPSDAGVSRAEFFFFFRAAASEFFSFPSWTASLALSEEGSLDSSVEESS